MPIDFKALGERMRIERERKTDLAAWADGKYVVAGTGSRGFCTLPPGADQPILARLYTLLRGTQEKRPNLAVLSGAAEGWDHALTLVAKDLGIPYALAIPNGGYGRYYWGQNSLLGQDRTRLFDEMIEGAVALEYTTDQLDISDLARRHEGLHLNFWRNIRMVEIADAFVVYDITSRGTSHCFRLIQEAEKPYRILG